MSYHITNTPNQNKQTKNPKKKPWASESPPKQDFCICHSGLWSLNKTILLTKLFLSSRPISKAHYWNCPHLGRSICLFSKGRESSFCLFGPLQHILRAQIFLKSQLAALLPPGVATCSARVSMDGRAPGCLWNVLLLKTEQNSAMPTIQLDGSKLQGWQGLPKICQPILHLDSRQVDRQWGLETSSSV